MTFDSNRFESLVQVLENKYFCPKLQIEEIPLTKQQKSKVRFDSDDLHFERNQDLESNVLTVPAYYVEDINLPLLGNKFLRYQIDFNKGNLLKITIEKGHWKLKNSDLRFREYVVPNPKTDRHTVYFNYWFEEERWAMVRQDKWNEMQAEMENDLNDPLLKELEHEFHKILREAAVIRESLFLSNTVTEARQYLNILKKLFWYIENVPKLWYIFNICEFEFYERIQRRLTKVKKIFPSANKFIKEKETEPEDEVTAEINNTASPLRVLFLTAYAFLIDGYEVIEGNSYPSLKTIFTIRKEFEHHANLETLSEYKEACMELANKKQKDFILLDDIKAHIKIHKKK